LFNNWLSAVVYARLFDLEMICDATPRYNVAPTESVLAIQETDQGTWELLALRWG
jgi:putative SOS response-associated peptidase YedK